MTDQTVESAFSSNYVEAREKFIRAALGAGARLAHYRHPDATGPAGEALYLDVATLGPPAATNMMAVGSGTHGIEGYPGSAAQTAWLRRGDASRLPPDTAVVFLHGHNPWGFAHRQRVTEENVDLNRNFVDHEAPYPDNPGYDELHPMITPTQWDEQTIPSVFAALESFRERVGEKAFSDAYNGGQYSAPDGVFFGGHRPQWANLAFRAAVRQHLGHAGRSALIDLHTGIGPWLDHVFLCFHSPGSPPYERARRWWGERAVNRQGSTHKALASYRGLLVDAFQAELSDTETTAVVIEFGTLSRAEMQRANMSLPWLRKHGPAHPDRAAAVFDTYVEAFYPSDPAWRAAVLEQSRVFIDQAVAGLPAS